MTRLLLRLGSSLLLFGGVLVACGCGGSQTPEEEVRAAPVKAKAARKVVMGEWTELLGTTLPLPNQVGRVSAGVEGEVLAPGELSPGKVVTEGQDVRADDVILQLNDKLVQANHDKAEAALRELVEQRKQANLALEAARLAHNSKKELRKKEVELHKQPGELVTDLELANARIAEEDAASKLRGLDAKEAAGKAEVKVLDEQVKLYKLRAPISGRLGIIQAVPGQVIPAGTTVAEIVNLDEIDVLCMVPAHVAAKLALGKPARILKDDPAQDDLSSRGKVVFISVQAQPDTGTFAVKLRFPNKDLGLRVNSVVRAAVLTQPPIQRLTIPEAALQEDQDPPAVVLVQDLQVERNKEGKDEKLGKARKLEAVIGIRDRQWQLVEIVGLRDPEKKQSVPLTNALFIVEGGHGLEDGDRIKLDEEEEEEEK